MLLVSVYNGGLTESQYLPEDVYAVKAISRISSTGSVRIMFT